MSDVPQLCMRLPRLAFEVVPGDDFSEMATEEDAGGIAALLSAAFQEEWDADRVVRDLGPAQGVDASYVVRDQGRVVAVASARHLPEVFPGSGYLHYVAADASQSGRGLGAVVTKAVLRHFLDEGVGSAILETDDFRLPAIRTYLKLGFVPEYRHDEDQVRWSRVLPAVVARRGVGARGAVDA